MRPKSRHSPAIGLAAAIAAVITLIGLVVLWPSNTVLPDLGFLGVSNSVYEAEVIAVELGPCEGSQADSLPCRKATFEFTQGPDIGEVFHQDFPLIDSSPVFEVGEKVVLNSIEGASEGFEYQWADRQRRGVLAAVAVAFALAVVTLGRLRGMAALVGLVASIWVILRFVVPALLEGQSPVPVAVVGAATIAFLALYLAHGFTPKTTVALLGTLGALGLTAVLSAVVMEAAKISGFATEESFFLTLVPGQIDVAGLILAGVVLGALGALDDVTVTQASAVWEIRAARPDISRSELFAAGLRVGRDHISSTVNTLVLAYAGASMPLLVLFILSDLSLGSIANSEIVATEIVRTLVGSIGLVVAVPITTWLAARFSAGATDDVVDHDAVIQK